MKNYIYLVYLFIHFCCTGITYAQDTTSKTLRADYIEGTSSLSNYIVNPSAERNFTGVTCSGSWTNCARTTTSNQIVQGKGSYIFNTNSVGASVAFDSRSFTTNELKSNNCGASFDYSGGFNSDNGAQYEAYVTINGVKVTPDYVIQPVNDKTTVRATAVMPEIIFPCGDGSFAPKLVIESISSVGGAIYVDNVYLGKARTIGQIAQAEWVGQVTTQGAASCQWNAVVSGATFVSFGADTDCGTQAATGQVSSPGTKIPAVVLNNVKPGRYLFVTGGVAFNASSGFCYYRLWDGTQGSSIAGGANVVVGQNLGSASLEYTTAQSSVTVQFQANANTSTTCSIVNDSASASFKIDVYYFPTSTQTAVSIANSNFGLTNAGTITIGSTGSAPTKGTLTVDRVEVERKGQFAWITYRWNTTVAGSNGTGDYLLDLPLGLTFDSNWITSFTGSLNDAAAMSRSLISVDGSGYSVTGGAIIDVTAVLPYDSNSFRVILRTQGSTQAFWSQSHYGQGVLGFSFTLKVPITGWTENQNAPLLVGSVTSAYGGAYRFEAADINCDAASAITSQTGFLTSVGNRSTTSCALTITSGVFSTTPYTCNVTVKAATVQATSCSCSSATSCTIYGPSADYDAYVTISGPR